jgi:hypothetical protein
MAAVTALANDWLERLGTEEGVHLAEELDRFPELRDAVDPEPRRRAQKWQNDQRVVDPFLVLPFDLLFCSLPPGTGERGAKALLAPEGTSSRNAPGPVSGSLRRSGSNAPDTSFLASPLPGPPEGGWTIKRRRPIDALVHRKSYPSDGSRWHCYAACCLPLAIGSAQAGRGQLLHRPATQQGSSRTNRTSPAARSPNSRPGITVGSIM